MHETERTPPVKKRIKKIAEKPGDTVNLVISLKESGEISFGHDAQSEEQVYLIIAILSGIRDGTVYKEICRQSPELNQIMKDDLWDGDVPYVDLTDDRGDDEIG